MKRTGVYMLKSLHVRNLALITEEEIDFTPGLNILTGETGAGKSIILGALGLALGDRASKDFLRGEENEALVEAVFSAESDTIKKSLADLDVDTSDGEVILSRKLTVSASKSKINGEMVPVSLAKETGSFLLDIYGQKDHHSLLNKKNHLELVDSFCSSEIKELLTDLKAAYDKFSALSKELKEAESDSANKAREIALLEHEVAELEEANLKVGEDEQLEDDYRRMSSHSKLMEAANTAHLAMSDNGASDSISRSISALKAVEGLDATIDNLLAALRDAESLVDDFNREISSYISAEDFSQEDFATVENRLNQINRLKDKYGNTIEAVIDAYNIRQERLAKLNDFDAYLSGLKIDLDSAQKSLDELCEIVSVIRQKNAKELSEKIKAQMSDLNFLASEFEIRFERLSGYSSIGFDECEIFISTNPGESLKPLKDVASGGELSRIMLAIKTVMASAGAIDTLIFDEIDAGISGKTAVAVSKCLMAVAKEHQVICITHLPQIAACADTHFLIEKNVVDSQTVSAIKRLDYEESVNELARMLAGDTITDAVLQNARELKKH